MRYLRTIKAEISVEQGVSCCHDSGSLTCLVLAIKVCKTPITKTSGWLRSRFRRNVLSPFLGTQSSSQCYTQEDHNAVCVTPTNNSEIHTPRQ